MAQSDANPVVVGVDGSEEALTAVEWAARQAHRLRRPLRVVHAFEWPLFHVRLGPPPGAPPWTGLTNAAQRIVSDAVERAQEAAPEAEVEGEYVEGLRRPVLLAETEHAHLIAVGSRGLGGVGALLIGSTGVELSARSACPVVVVPHPGDDSPRAGLVAAVDCSESSRLALEHALAEAAVRGVGLRVVLAWQGEGLRTAPGKGETPADHAATEEDARSRLAQFVAPHRERHPQVSIQEQVVRGSPRKTLVGETSGAELLVLGSRGLGEFRGLVMGSVSQAVLHQAGCPVAVVPSSR